MQDLYKTNPLKKQQVGDSPANDFHDLAWQLIEHDASFLRAVGEYLVSVPAVDGSAFDRGRLRSLLVRLPMPTPAERAEAQRHHHESAVRNGRPPCREFIVAAMVDVLTDYFGGVDCL